MGMMTQRLSDAGWRLRTLTLTGSLLPPPPPLLLLLLLCSSSSVLLWPAVRAVVVALVSCSLLEVRLGLLRGRATLTS